MQAVGSVNVALRLIKYDVVAAVFVEQQQLPDRAVGVTLVHGDTGRKDGPYKAQQQPASLGTTIRLPCAALISEPTALHVCWTKCISWLAKALKV
jgi:hypothetical protein